MKGTDQNAQLITQEWSLGQLYCRVFVGGGGHGRVQDDLVLVTKESVVKVGRRNSVKADVLALRLNVNGSL